LAASAAPSTPSGEFSVLGDFEEDRKPDIEYLDALNEHNKRSRSVENEGDAERKQAKVGEGSGGEGDGWGLLGQQAQENGEQQEHLPMNGVENSGRNAQDVMLADEDPTVYGLYFSLSFCLLLCVMFNEPSFSVDGKPMPFSQVGEEHHDLMTADEYTAYFEIFQQRSA